MGSHDLRYAAVLLDSPLRLLIQLCPVSRDLHELGVRGQGRGISGCQPCTAVHSACAGDPPYSGRGPVTLMRRARTFVAAIGEEPVISTIHLNGLSQLKLLYPAALHQHKKHSKTPSIPHLLSRNPLAWGGLNQLKKLCPGCSGLGGRASGVGVGRVRSWPGCHTIAVPVWDTQERTGQSRVLMPAVRLHGSLSNVSQKYTSSRPHSPPLPTHL